MTVRSWIRSLFARPPCTIRKAPARFRPAVEALEDRTLPAANFSAGTLPSSAAVRDFISEPPPVANQAPTVVVPGAQTANEDVDKSISGIKVGDPEGDGLKVILAVSHGKLTLGTTAGLTVSGSGTGKVTLSGSIADLNTALLGLRYRGSLNYSGADSLSITVGDGSLDTSGSVAISVKSASQQATALKAQVSALPLGAGQANALTVKLNLKGNAGDADKVRSFLAQVREFRSAGILTQTQADGLLGPGNDLLLSVTRR